MSYFQPIYLALQIVGAPIIIYFLYMLTLALLGVRKYERFPDAEHKNKFAAVIAARNEESVIGLLIDSLKQVDYPTELLDIWVIPNNCTDKTEQVALEHGAKVYRPYGPISSKGDALREFFDASLESDDYYDAYTVFDADNVIDPEFFLEMNKALEAGEPICQGYRESKNPKDSWISGSQSMFYWLTNRFLNRSKRTFGFSAVLNGTGFMVAREILLEQGFKTETMTEDIEYSTQSILRGQKIAFVAAAITYDEHPVDQKTSWKQRKRWSTGIIQTCYRYSGELFKNFLETKDFTNIDMILYLAAPFFQVLGFFYTVVTFVLYGILAIYSGYFTLPFFITVLTFVIGLFIAIFYSILVPKMEHHKLRDLNPTTFATFWWFLTSWIFINIEVFLNPITTWEPIAHRKSITLAEIQAI